MHSRLSVHIENVGFQFPDVFDSVNGMRFSNSPLRNSWLQFVGSFLRGRDVLYNRNPPFHQGFSMIFDHRHLKPCAAGKMFSQHLPTPPPPMRTYSFLQGFQCSHIGILCRIKIPDWREDPFLDSSFCGAARNRCFTNGFACFSTTVT